jgi:hypothetical protein
MSSLDDVFCKATGRADSPGSEVLAEQGLSTTAIEAFIALDKRWLVRGYQSKSQDTHGYSDIGDTTVALLETLDVLANFDSDSYSLVAGDQLRREGKVRERM